MKCESCNAYTLETKCKCGGNTFTPKPQKYSFPDKYADYRRKAKKEELKKRGWL